MKELFGVFQQEHWQEKKDEGLAFGVIGGYDAAVVKKGLCGLSVFVFSKSDAGAEEKKAFLETYSAKEKAIVKTECTQFGCRVEFRAKTPFHRGELAEKALDFLKEYTENAAERGESPCCGQCGASSPTGVYLEDGEFMRLCAECVAHKTEQNNATKKWKGNLFTAICGALLGALVGAALWIMLYRVGYVAVLAGFVMVFLAMKGFSLLGGHLNAGGILFCTALSVLTLAAAESICLGYQIYLAFGAEGLPFWECLKAVPVFLSFAEIRAMVLKEMALGYLMMAVGSYAAAARVFHRGKGLLCLEMPPEEEMEEESGEEPAEGDAPADQPQEEQEPAEEPAAAPEK